MATLFFLLLTCLTISTKCEIEQKKAEDKSRTNAILQSSKNNILKPAGWIFSPRNSSKSNQDQIPASAEFGGYHYLPPPSLNSDYDKDCSPCNLEPWVPIAGHSKYKHIFPNDFSSPMHSLESILSNNEYPGIYGIPPKIEYGVPKPLYGPPKTEYGPPKPEYELPKPEYVLPNPIYGPPKQQYRPPRPLYGAPPQPPPLPSSTGFIADYMLPPPLHYKIPSLVYGLPNNKYGPPPKPLYGAPPKPLNGPPKVYGPPKTDYGLPSKPDYGLPKPSYGLPPSIDYGPPKPNYLPPAQDFSPPNSEYAPPKPLYGPPPRQEYGLPPTIFNPPIYSAPPAPVYGGPPKPIYELPKPNYNIPNLPSPTQGIDSTVLEPVPQTFSNVNNLQDPISQGFIPPPQASISNSPSIIDNFPQYVDNPASQLSDIPLDNGFIPPPVPSDSYGNTVTGDNFDFNSQLDSLPAPSGDNDHPSNGHQGFQNNHPRSQNSQINLQSIQNAQVHLPNLSPVPVLPIYEFRNFRGSKESPTNDQNVQVQQSVKVADYVASVEHPINIIQSPLVELQINEDQNYQNNSSYNRNAKTHYPDLQQFPDNIENFKLSENPIVVEDTHTAASNINSNISNLDESQKRNTDNYSSNPNSGTNNILKINKLQGHTDFIKQILLKKGILSDPKTKLVDPKAVTQNSTFKFPTLDNDDWVPKYYPPISSSMVPPPFNSKSPWIQTSTQKPIQIIIPYTNKMPPSNNKKPAESYTTLVPSYTPPMPTESSVWAKYLNNIEITKLNKVTGKPFTKHTTTVYNIKDLLASNSYNNSTREQLPYDIISLQKNIDDWTHQSFSQGKIGTEQVLPPKQIPANFFTTKPVPETTTYSNEIFDHHLAESSRKETTVDADIETNIIVAAETVSTEITTTHSPTTLEDNKVGKSSWKSAYVTVSPYTKEKIYVVTPQAYSFVTASPAKAWSMAPKIENGTSNNITLDSQRFSIRIEPQSQESREKMQKKMKNAIKVVYSEWPHLINNLQTTTSKPTSGHPLFGLMGITAYTPPPNSTIETFFGHSKVVTVVTPSSKTKNTKNI